MRAKIKSNINVRYSDFSYMEANKLNIPKILPKISETALFKV